MKKLETVCTLQELSVGRIKGPIHDGIQHALLITGRGLEASDMPEMMVYNSFDIVFRRHERYPIYDSRLTHRSPKSPDTMTKTVILEGMNELGLNEALVGVLGCMLPEDPVRLGFTSGELKAIRSLGLGISEIEQLEQYFPNPDKYYVGNFQGVMGNHQWAGIALHSAESRRLLGLYGSVR